MNSANDLMILEENDSDVPTSPHRQKSNDSPLIPTGLDQQNQTAGSLVSLDLPSSDLSQEEPQNAKANHSKAVKPEATTTTNSKKVYARLDSSAVKNQIRQTAREWNEEEEEDEADQKTKQKDEQIVFPTSVRENFQINEEEKQSKPESSLYQIESQNGQQKLIKEGKTVQFQDNLQVKQSPNLRNQGKSIANIHPTLVKIQPENRTQSPRKFENIIFQENEDQSPVKLTESNAGRKRAKLDPLPKNNKKTEDSFQSSNVILSSSIKQKKIDDSLHNMASSRIQNNANLLLPVRSLQCTLTISLSLLSNRQFLLMGKDKSLLMTCRKQSSFCMCSQYIGRSSNDDSLIGRMRGNWFGSTFNVWTGDSEEQQLTATISYHTDCSCTQSVRKLDVYLRDQSVAYSSLEGWSPSQPSLQELYSLNPGQIRHFKTKEPVYSSKLGSYTMNFRGKCRIPSIQNMIIVDARTEHQALMICKSGENRFYVEIDEPFSVMVSMAIICSGFDFKIACQ